MVRNRLLGNSSRTAEPMAALLALACPDKRRRVSILAASRGFEPLNNLSRCFGVLSIQDPSFQDTLDGFGHIEPRTTQRGIQG
jgi:hypothetical protein